MSTQYCRCGCYRFAHVASVGKCDLCECSEYSVCPLCAGSRVVHAAPVAAIADWTRTITVACPNCTQ